MRHQWRFPRSSDEAVRAALLAFHRDDAVRRQDRKAGEAGSRGAAFAEKKSHLPEHSSFYLAARARAKRKRVHPATGSGDDLVAQTGVAY